MDLDIKIVGLEEMIDQAIFDYYEEMVDTLKVTYSKAYAEQRDYHYKNLSFTLVVRANLNGRCFDFVGVEGEYNKNKHDRAMLINNVKVFFKPV